MINSISSENLKKLINSHGNLTVNELANETGIPQPTLYRLLTGKTLKPKKDVLQKIADYLGLPLKGLMEIIAVKENKSIEVPVFVESDFSLISGFSEATCLRKVKFEIKEDDSGEYIAIQLDRLQHAPFLCEHAIAIINTNAKLADRSLIAIYIKKDGSIMIDRLIKEGGKLYIKERKKINNELSLKVINEKELIIIGVVVEIRFLESN